jgi:putative phosphoesterase
MRIGLISDTHGRLRPRVFDIFNGVDLILHAGDIGPPGILAELAAIAPVHAVTGNTDSREVRARTAETVALELAGHRIVLLHGHTLGSPAPDRLRALHPDADVIIYGHTHRQRTDIIDGCLIINPGAAGPPRFNLKPAVAILTLETGTPPHVEHIEL